jgi:hypothetical protein
MFKSLMAILLVLSIPAFGQKVLDGGATSPAAFSLRQLATTYTHTPITPPTAVSGFTNSSTPLIRVRRSPDNQELDIGYLSSGDLDTVTLKSFVGANNGWVSVWYDQSGNSRDASQTNATLQPQIVASGNIFRRNNVPTVYFNLQRLSTANFSGAYSSGYTLAICAGVNNFTSFK